MTVNQNASANSAAREKSPYARVGAKLVEQGFSAIPILAGTKRPPMNDWSRFCDRPPTELESNVWSNMPNAGVGIACGFNGIVALDFDTNDHRAIEAIMAVLPHALVEKAGCRGFTAFYRTDEAIESREFDIDGKRVLDLLSDGRQTVIPPSLHPQTGRPYVWTTPLGLEDIRPEHLETLPADIAERIAEALKPLGYLQPAPKREYDYDDFDGVHDAAMANLDSWAPQLGIPFFRSHNGKYRAVATWRGGDGYNVSFAPQGIKDFVTGEGFSPSGLVERALGIDSWDSDNWLREKLGLQPLPKVVFTFRKPGDRQKTLGVSASDLLDKDVGAPEFIVDGWLQNRKVGLLLGEDGAGKSFLLLDLAIAVATGGNWLDPTVRAPVLFVSAEEEERDIKKRLQVALTRGLSARTGNLHIISVDTIDQDYGGAVLAEVDEKTRKISMTKLWDAVVRKVESVNPKLLILEQLNELFDGDEMVRRQARQFIDNLRRLARKRDMPVLLGAHPSNTSMNERRPGAGTNGWNAAVRMRWWLEVIRDNGDATNERKLHRMKVTGARNDRVPIDLVVGEGGWLVLKDEPKVETEEGGGLGAGLAKIERDKLAFMDAIEKKFALGVFLTASPASPKGYAPRAIVNDEGGRDRGARIKANERIMDDLLTEGRIASKQYGPKSKDKWRLEVVSRTLLLPSEKEKKDDEDEG
jgi:KaiC/GvpD/RAD55 family RecA-like ATPase